jgi:hypothetical protein
VGGVREITALIVQGLNHLHHQARLRQHYLPGQKPGKDLCLSIETEISLTLTVQTFSQTGVIMVLTTTVSESEQITTHVVGNSHLHLGAVSGPTATAAGGTHASIVQPESIVRIASSEAAASPVL